jgi:histidyl-tRNA synthetase
VLVVLEQLRDQGLAVLMHAGGGSMKSQFKRADASGARHALIFGADELQQGLVAVKSLRDPAAGQTNQSINQVPAWAAQLRHP